MLILANQYIVLILHIICNKNLYIIFISLYIKFYLYIIFI